MNKNKSYLPKHKLIGFSNYYETDQGEIVNKLTNNFIGINRDRSWHYYSLVNDKGIRVKVGIDNLVRKPYFSSFYFSYSEETLNSCRELGFV